MVGLSSDLFLLISLHYLGKHEPHQKLCLFSNWDAASSCWCRGQASCIRALASNPRSSSRLGLDPDCYRRPQIGADKYCVVSCCSSWTVSRAQCAGALSCSNTYVSPAMWRMTGSICFFSKTSWSYLPSTFTPGSTKNSSVQQHLCQKLPKSVDARRSYSVLHQCRFFETQCSINHPNWRCWHLEQLLYSILMNCYHIKCRQYFVLHSHYVRVSSMTRNWCVVNVPVSVKTQVSNCVTWTTTTLLTAVGSISSICSTLLCTLCLKKVPTCKLSVTLSNFNRFLKFLHCWKAYEICYKTHMTPPTSP